MKKTLSLLISASLLSVSASSLASTIEGTVKDEQGRPIVGAKVFFEGAVNHTFTDENGKYRLENAPDDHAHLHVYSATHIHGDRDIELRGATQIEDFVLLDSAIENVVVTAHVLTTSTLESTTPVSVISERELRKNQAATLGDVLQSSPGVHTSYFGPVSSTPIIRGTDGPRVKIVQNGLDASDVSRVGADHNVAVDVSTAYQVEVLRGPATLQYGTGAIGGVVNVVDNRIPRYVPDELEGEVEARYESVSDERFAKVDLNAGSGNWAFHIDAFDRDTENYEIPGFAEAEPDEDEAPGELPNSSIDTTSVTTGVSYVADDGFIGLSFQKLENLYGLPGHSHGHGDEHEDEHEEEEEHGHEEGEEEIVNLDVDMSRYQLVGELNSPFEGFSNLKFSSGYTDYEHTELEGGAIGTTFKNETWESRLSLEHRPIDEWHGVLGFHYANSDYEAIGEEAFTPPSETDSISVFLIEEKKFGDLSAQFGIRYDYTKITPISEFEVELDIHGEEEHHDEHDEDHDEHEEDHDEHDEEHDEHEEEHVQHLDFMLDEQSFSSLSLSAGLNWAYQEGRSLSVSLSRSERAPSAAELFSAGAHLATQSYEIGALFDLDDDGDLSLRSGDVNEEVSTNIDVTLRKFDGDWGYSISLFYNQVDDYLYLANTGFEAFAGHEDEHGHEEEHDEHEEEHEEGHEEEHEDEHGHEEGHDEEGLPVFVFRQNDADLYGFEAQVNGQLNDAFALEVFADYTRAKLNGGDDLPRIPPLRIGAELDFEYQNWTADLGLTWYDEQDRVSEFEESTPGYTLVSASVNYQTEYQGVDWTVFFKAKNITDREARVHTSFIKDQAPLPGRNFVLGVRANF